MVQVRIMIEGTPNPNAMKFVLDRQVQYRGSSTYSRGDTPSVNLAKCLLEIAGIESVFFMDTFITVTKLGASAWDGLTSQIESVIRTHLDSHDPAIEPQVVDSSKLSLDDRLTRINQILDRDVRPGLASDGGGLELVSLEGNTLKVKYQGACGSCPSSMTGTLMAIQDLLRREFDPNLEVLPGTDQPFKSMFRSFS